MRRHFNALAANPGANGIIATGGTASRGLANALKDYYASTAKQNISLQLQQIHLKKL